MSPPPSLQLIGNVSFPRVSGDEPAAFGISPAQLAFSPRERG